MLAPSGEANQLTSSRSVYQQARGWNAGVGGLPFLGVCVGMMGGKFDESMHAQLPELSFWFIACAYTIIYDNNRYIKQVDKHGGRAPPEARLPPSMLGGFLLVIGLAWFAATDAPTVHWAASVVAGVPFGFGMVLVFLALMN